MQIENFKLEEHNHTLLKEHQRKFEFIIAGIKNHEAIIKKLW